MHIDQTGIPMKEVKPDYNSLLGVSDGVIIATLAAFAEVLFA